LEFYLIADNNRSRAQLRKSGKNCFESDEDLEKIEFLKSKFSFLLFLFTLPI
jgi:hypothetical protein